MASDMTAQRGRGKRYRAPDHILTPTLEELLQETGRTTTTQQLFSEANSPNGKRTPLWCAGDIALLRQRCVAIVGSRKVSLDGTKRAERLARELSHAGVVVVSGLAEGVDTDALTAAIAAGGKVVAIIGTPIDKAYPATNKRLQEDIHASHLLISQFAPGERVFRSNFPARNRLMATLSDATVIVEASETSGTLHQAAECLRLNRMLFITRSLAENPNLTWPAKFLRAGNAHVLSDTDDILGRL